MKTMSGHGMKAVWVLTILSLVAAAVIVFVDSNEHGLVAARWVGYGFWALSAILGWAPILTLRARGNTPRGKSYVHTTQLVTSGIYGVVRHPQYLAFSLLGSATVFIAQQWYIILPAAIGITGGYLAAIEGDRSGLKQFGEAYRRYMEQVPRFNPVTGLIRFWRRRT